MQPVLKASCAASGSDSSSRCHCPAVLGGQGAVHPTDLQKILLKYIFRKMFDISLSKHLLLKQYCCIAYLFFLMNLIHTKIKELNLCKIVLHFGRIYL